MDFLFLATLYCLLFQFSHQQVLYRNVTVRYKTDISLLCGTLTMSRDNITFSDAAFYKQKINSTSQLITNDLNDIKYTISDSILVIKSPRREDLETQFFCTSKSNNLTIAFNFQVAPFFYRVEKTKYTLTEENEIEVTCKILFGNEDDKVQFKWLLKDQVLQNRTDKYVIRNQDDQTLLQIQMVTMEDAGLYTCQAINLYGKSALSIRISIKSSLAPLWPFLGILFEIFIIGMFLKYCKLEPDRPRKMK